MHIFENYQLLHTHAQFQGHSPLTLSKVKR